jgi:hypothetical protein
MQKLRVKILATDEELDFPSINAAAKYLKLSRAAINATIFGINNITSLQFKITKL